MAGRGRNAGARRGASGKGQGRRIGQPNPANKTPIPDPTKRGWFLCCPCIPKGGPKPQISIWWSQTYKGMQETCHNCGAKWSTVAERQGFQLPTVQRQPLPGQAVQPRAKAGAAGKPNNAKGVGGAQPRAPVLADFIKGVLPPSPAPAAVASTLAEYAS